MDAVSLNSAWSSLPAGCSNSMIVNLVSNVLSLSAAQGCAFEMPCGIADSAGCPVLIDSEDISAFAAQDLKVRDRAEVRALIVISLAPLFFFIVLVTPLQLWWIDFWQVQHITAFAAVDFLQMPHRGAGPWFVSTSPA